MNKQLISGVITAAMLAAMAPMCVPVSAASTLLAFPGAEGAGRYATGGRGGKIYHVTNLNDSGTGSFRDAVSGSNRVVVFDVGGTITLKSDVVVKGNITILGQTAPGGGGITLSGYKLGQGGDNQIIRFVSSRPGERGAGEYDAWGGSSGSNSIVDHCSIGWGNDEQWGLYSNNMNQTVQYTIIGPSNCVSTHAKGLHGFGVMFGKGQNSWHHNMIAHNISRNFRGKVEKTNSMDFVNNVMYDWGYQTAYGTLGHINYVGNYLKAGNGTTGSYHFMVRSSGSAIENYKFFVNGNTIRKKDGSVYSDSIEQDNWGGVGFDEAVYRSYEHFPVNDINGGDASVAPNAQTAEEAFETVLTYAGAGISSEKRPRIDQEVMAEARTGTGYLTGACVDTVTDSDQKSAISKYNIQQVDYEEYYPETVQKTITDSDGDGMPDEWEIARGLNPNKDDAAEDYLGQGYMNIEYYANDLTINAFPEGVVTESPTSVDLGPEYEMVKADLAALKLSPTTVKTAAELTLPQKGSVNGLDITWTSSSSAVRIKDNQVYQVTRAAEDKSVSLTATITAGNYTMNKSFAVTVLSNNTFWKASGNVTAGAELFDGLTPVSDMTYKAAEITLGGTVFGGYVSGTENGGIDKGTSFRFTADRNGFLTAYVNKLGSAENAKTLYITEADSGNAVEQISGYGEAETLTAQVSAGKTYYVYVAGSKGQFLGIEFSETAKPVWWRASKAIAAGDTLMEGLTASGTFAYSETSKNIDGEDFTGRVNGAENPADNGASGAALKYIPAADGEFTIYSKVGAGKTLTINAADGEPVNSYTNESEVSEYTSLSGDLKKGETYYIYVAGSKAELYGASFTPEFADENDTPATAAPTASPAATESATEQPSAELKVMFDKSSFASGDEVVLTVDNAEGNDVYLAEYDENGVLVGLGKETAAESRYQKTIRTGADTVVIKAMVWNGEVPETDCKAIYRQ